HDALLICYCILYYRKLMSTSSVQCGCVLGNSLVCWKEGNEQLTVFQGLMGSEHLVARWLSCLHCLHGRLTAKKVMGAIPAWGAGPPQSAQCSGGLSPGPFCVEFACSPRV